MIPDHLFYRGMKYIPEAPAPPVGLRWARIPHDVERVNVDTGDFRYRADLPEYRDNPRGGPVRANVIKAGKRLPEVYRMNPDHHTLVKCPAQKLWRGLNPELNDERWSSLMDGGLAWMNGGAGMPGHINCITGEGSDETTYPRYDEARMCGGAMVLVWQDLTVAWIESMLSTEPVKTAAEVLPHQEWWYWGTAVDPSGDVHLITRPSGENSDGPPVGVRIINFTAQPVWLPADELHWLPDGFIPPSPLWMPEASSLYRQT